MPGPHEVLHHPVHREKVLDARDGANHLHGVPDGSSRHGTDVEQGAENLRQGPKDQALEGIQQLDLKCSDRAGLQTAHPQAVPSPVKPVTS